MKSGDSAHFNSLHEQLQQEKMPFNEVYVDNNAQSQRVNHMSHDESQVNRADQLQKNGKSSSLVSRYGQSQQDKVPFNEVH